MLLYNVNVSDKVLEVICLMGKRKWLISAIPEAIPNTG